jgi:aryl-alcohol dehydrogenase-like predicted oxidoreductase
VLAALESAAGEANATVGQAAIAWVLAKRRPQVIPIVGARSAEQLVENLAAADVELSLEALAAIDEAAAPALGFPRSFLESDDVRGLIYGETWPLLELA